jgi:hypothetical protein
MKKVFINVFNIASNGPVDFGQDCIAFSIENTGTAIFTTGYGDRLAANENKQFPPLPYGYTYGNDLTIQFAATGNASAKVTCLIVR